MSLRLFVQLYERRSTVGLTDDDADTDKSQRRTHTATSPPPSSERIPFLQGYADRRPFIIDLESTNGTHVNDQEVPKSRYYELRSSDVIKFGTSSREYVLLHEDASA